METQEYDKDQELIFFGIDFTKEKNYIFEHWRLIVIISLTTLILLLATMPKTESNSVYQQIGGGFKDKFLGKLQKNQGDFKTMGKNALSSAGETAKQAGQAGIAAAQTGMIRLAGIILTIAITFFFLIVFMPITALFFIIFISIALLKPKIIYLKSL
jgi:hypothetical protein